LTKAYEHFDKAVALDSAEADIYFEYGKAQFSEKLYAEANMKFQKAIELGVLNVGAYIFSGVCYYYQNEFDSAIEILNRAIAKDETIKSAYLWRANSYAALSKNAEACTDYKKCQELDPNDGFVNEQVKKFCSQ
jgi:Tfp pilus assembly protein PilF